jgi:ketosteroid isomerase-like protein
MRCKGNGEISMSTQENVQIVKNFLAGLADVLQKANETVETSYPEPPEFIAQGDRVVVVGFATGRIKATNKTFEDHWVFAITVRNGKLTNIREYIDTQALARASEMHARPRL